VRVETSERNTHTYTPLALLLPRFPNQLERQGEIERERERERNKQRQRERERERERRDKRSDTGNGATFPGA
jgi:hypothetical protein